MFLLSLKSFRLSHCSSFFWPFCLFAVEALIKCHGSNVRMPFKQRKNAMEAWLLIHSYNKPHPAPSLNKGLIGWLFKRCFAAV